MARHPDTGDMLPPKRRTIDIGVFDNGKLVAVIESEHDVADARDFGQLRGRRGGDGNYAVDSLAARLDGRSFRSYLSLERMAYAAMAHAFPQLSTDDVTNRLAALSSNSAEHHNPAQLETYLILEVLDPKVAILEDRMRSLGCRLLVAS